MEYTKIENLEDATLVDEMVSVSKRLNALMRHWVQLNRELEKRLTNTKDTQ